MENEFFLNLGNGTIPPSLVHFESTPSIDIQTPDCFLNSHHNFHFNSNSNPSNESFMIRELIGQLGSIGNSSVRKSMPLNSTVVGEFSADPGFAERAARLSCFGSRSFNGRNNNNSSSQLLQNYGSNSLIVNEGISRVSSSPSLKALGSELGFLQNKNSSNEMANSQDESTLSDQNPNGEKGLLNSRKRKAFSKGKLKEPPSSSSPSKVVEVNDKSSSKRCKVAESNENEKGNVKNEEESKKNDGSGGEEKQTKTNSKPPEPPKDYIHVRARRGQATDSHSLAERVRREKISERMKLLQDLVPGCNKVTGKALMLDEIINYVQSLQHQVEFLSMKLASVNTRADFNMDSLISKEMYQSGNPLTHPQISPIDSSASAFYGQQQPQQNAALPSSSYGAPRATPHCSVDPLDSVLCQLPSLNPFTENPSQYPTFGEDDLQTIVQMGFVQNQNQEISLQSQNFNIGSDMKIEL